jgi:hypothetical protein
MRVDKICINPSDQGALYETASRSHLAPVRMRRNHPPATIHIIRGQTAMSRFLTAQSHADIAVQRESRITRITDGDHDHMKAFPAPQKLRLIEKIMSCSPATSAAFSGNNHYERAILRLRRDDFHLIDLQPQEFLFTSVWFKKCRSALGMPRVEIAMLLWTADEELTHLRTWRL